MKALTGLATIWLLAVSVTLGAEQSWTGKIGDSMCGASHKGATEHQGKNLSDAECVAACISGGAKYVFVQDGKVYRIDNQDFASLADQAGHEVKLTGEMTGDSVKVNKIEMPAAKKTS